MRFLTWSVLKGTRSFHAGHFLFCDAKPKVDKQLLSRLRKKTGFPFIKCREALEKFDNDITEAEKWMKKMALSQGWSTAGKLASRPMSQGVIGVLAAKDCAVMVEVNCETDFVARNTSFQGLVSTVADTCLNHGIQRTVEGEMSKLELSRNEIENLHPQTASEKKIGDLVAITIGSIGENMCVRRAGFMRASNEKDVNVAHYCHTPWSSSESGTRCQYGKYGSLLFYESKNTDDVREANDCARNVCQHIVGMNPIRVGNINNDKPKNNKDDEPLLIYQPYLLNEDITVQDYIDPYLIPIDFMRYQCGESLPTDDE